MKGPLQSKEFLTPEPIPEVPREDDNDQVAAQLLASLPVNVQRLTMNAPQSEVWPTPVQMAASAPLPPSDPSQQSPDPNQSGPTRAGPAARSQGGETNSYWSVPEKQDFLNYINYFGTDWAKIAQTMKTKTATMVIASIY